MTQKRIIAILAVLVVIASHLALQFQFLDDYLVKNDEAFTLFVGQQTYGDLMHSIDDEPNPPGLFLALHVWIELFGLDSWAVHLFPVFFHILTAVVLFLFVRSVGSLESGLFASILYFCHFGLFLYSSEIRYVPLVNFLVVSSVYLSWKLFVYSGRLIKSIGLWVGLTLCFTGLVYIHYNTIYIPIVCGLFLLIFGSKTNKLGVLLVGGLSFLLFLPQFIHMLGHVPKDHSYWRDLSSLSELQYALMRYAGEVKWVVYLMIGLLPVLIYQIIQKNKIVLFLTLLFVLPISMCYLVGKVLPVFGINYLMYSSVVLIALESVVIHGISKISLRGIWSKIPVFISIALFVVMGTLTIYSFKPAVFKNEDFKSVASYLQLNRNNEKVFVQAGYKMIDLVYYYRADLFKDYKNYPTNAHEVGLWEFSESVFLNAAEDSAVYMVYAHEDVIDPQGRTDRLVQSTFTPCLNFGTEEQVEISYFRKEAECNEVKQPGSSITKNGLFLENEIQMGEMHAQKFQWNSSKKETFWSKNPFAPGAEFDLDTVFHPIGIRYKVHFKQEAENGGILVLAISSNHKEMYRTTKKLEVSSEFHWADISMLLQGYSHSQIKCYMWNPTNVPTEIDSIEIYLFTQQDQLIDNSL